MKDKSTPLYRFKLKTAQVLFFFKDGRSECRESQCWCVSANGNDDECYDRNDCPGNGYWCDGTYNLFRVFIKGI